MATETAGKYQTKSAVLFIIFNRPDFTNKVFEQIKAARPPRLYVAADGPRAHVTEEALKCEQARDIIKLIDWNCELKTLFRPHNLGCGNAVSSAITWFFNHEEEGIILEDDCLPSNSFFSFCDTMLDTYRHDTRIRHIGGSNLQLGHKRGEASYYFSNLTHVWGWAGWRRVWKDYDFDLTKYKAEDVKEQLSKIFAEPLINVTWEAIFTQVQQHKIDTWDYQLTFLNFFNNSLSVIPNVNLISNIGYTAGATHTSDADNPYANLSAGELSEITHPLYILPEKEADEFTLNIEFKIPAIKAKINKPTRRLKRWLRAQFKG